ncbi:MAG: hypothetical protein ACOCUS_03520, partial [Polyangiales bacterium]
PTRRTIAKRLHESYRDAVADVLTKCGRGAEDVFECDPAPDASGLEVVREALFEPLWSQGFWSSETALTGIFSGVAPEAVVAPEAGSDPTGLYVVYADPDTDVLRVNILPDPVAPSVTPGPDFAVGDRLASGPAPRTREQPAATVGADGVLRIAYVDAGSGTVRIVRRGLDGTWTDRAAAVSRKAAGGVAIGLVGGAETVVFAPSSGDRLLAVTELGVVDSLMGQRLRPELTRIREGGTERWLLTALVPGTEGATVEARELSPAGFGSSPETLQVLQPQRSPALDEPPPSPFTLDAPRVPLVGTADSPSLATGVFPLGGELRLQVVVEGAREPEIGGLVLRPAFASMPVRVDAAGFDFDFERASRPVMLQPRYGGGFASAQFDDPELGSTAVLVGRAGAGRTGIATDQLAVTYKRSD